MLQKVTHHTRQQLVVIGDYIRECKSREMGSQALLFQLCFESWSHAPMDSNRILLHMNTHTKQRADPGDLIRII